MMNMIQKQQLAQRDDKKQPENASTNSTIKVANHLIS